VPQSLRSSTADGAGNDPTIPILLIRFVRASFRWIAIKSLSGLIRLRLFFSLPNQKLVEL
jgi:hypothetical protein